MKRRNFLRSAGALSLPALLNGSLAADPVSLFTPFINPNTDKVLVLIRLSGGNDGLNTVIGLDQHANLQAVRGNVVIPSADALNLTPTTGLHPAMTGMKDLFDNGMLGVVQAVGYPNQNRSHFRSTDIWSTGSDADEVLTTGWAGRYFDTDHPTYPTNYPNAQTPYPIAMTMGNVVSATCQGPASNFSVAVNNPATYQYIAPGGNTPLPMGYYGTEVDYVRTLIGQSNLYGSIVQNAAAAGTNAVTTYTTGTLSRQLQRIAQVISGGLETKIYVATLGGFDTHAGQTDGTDTTVGVHADLLRELSDSIKAFQDDLAAQGLADRVMGLTFSEFGRRIRSNQSTGTDHGDAAPLFVFGNCVQGGVTGTSPVIDTQVDQGTGVPYQYDFRDVYGSVLTDWFDVPSATAQSLFTGGFTYLPIFNGCSASLPVDLLSMVATGREKDVLVEWATSREEDNAGFVVQRSTDGRNFRAVGRVAAGRQGEGGNDYEFIDRNVSVGTLYYYRLKQEDTSGEFEYSPIQTARLVGTKKGDWAVGLPRPNPVNADTYVNVYAPTDATATVELFDVRGARLRQDRVGLGGGRDNRVALRPENLTAGTYVWRLRTDDGQQFSRKFVR